jgi:coenzyme F420-0:L-glutamate ligase/coenzyme F420-1:gamma-L-glutamate ligase
MTDSGRTPTAPDQITVRAFSWPEVEPGTDLADLVSGIADLQTGDVVVITSKVVSKAEGQQSRDPRATVVARDTRRVVARRGESVIAETRHGLVMAAAGVDASNVADGLVLSLPVDPDATARRIRASVWQRLSVNVAIVITDTAGRAWRHGQTDIAIGASGIDPVLDLAGTRDAAGHVLLVTAPALADEIAATTDLVKGKDTGRPVAVIRGLGEFVLPPGTHGPGATALVRDPATDLFGLGARDAVEAAVRRDGPQLAHFASRIESDAEPFSAIRCPHADVQVAVTQVSEMSGTVGWVVEVEIREGAGADAWLAAGRVAEAIETLAAAHRLRAVRPAEHHSQVTGWPAVLRFGWEPA